MIKNLLIILTLFVGIIPIYSQRNNSLAELEESRAMLMRAERFTEDTLRKLFPDLSSYPEWVKGSSLVHFSIVGNDGRKVFYLAEAPTGHITKLFSAEEYAGKIAEFTDKKIDFTNPRFVITGIDSSGILSCRAEGRELLYDRLNCEFRLPDPEAVKAASAKHKRNGNPWDCYSSDDMFSIYGRGHNLFLKRTDNPDADSIIQLTFDAEPFYSFTSPNSTNTDVNPRSWDGEWFRDTHIAYTLRIDSRKVTTYTILNSVTDPYPTAREYKFEVAGDTDVRQFELWLLNADSAKLVQVDIAKFKDQEVKLVYNYDEEHSFDAIYFTRKNRTCDTLELCKVDPCTAQVSVVVSEISHPIVNEVLLNFAIINGGDEIIWWSERTGKGAFYLYDGNGNLKNRITGSNLLAANIFAIDTLDRSMIFEGYGYNPAGNPYYKHYYRIDFDGTKLIELTPAEGEHSIKLSPDKKFLTDRYSTVENMPQVEIRDMEGHLMTKIPMPVDSTLVAWGWSRPRMEKVKAADDSTDLYGVMYTPSNLISDKKYPVICAVYPGPHTDLVPKDFGLDHNHNGSLAQAGFIVLQFGYRGTSPLRGREFFTFGHGNLRDYALEDCIYVVRQLAERYPYIDTARVGIYGHSGGGFMSTAAILNYPDFFKVAIAVSGNHDNNIYGKYWSEPYHGVVCKLEKDTLGTDIVRFGSKVPTTLELADRLEGHLFLISGELDDNVHPANTIRMADALIRAGKRFDMLILPRLDHGMIGSYYYNLIRYYFEEHLKNPKPFDVNILCI